MYLNTWSPADGAVVESNRSSGGIALLEKALPWWGADLEGLWPHTTLCSVCDNVVS